MDLISSGEFHLDPIRAREKLREFQLPSPAWRRRSEDGGRKTEIRGQEAPPTFAMTSDL